MNAEQTQVLVDIVRGVEKLEREMRTDNDTRTVRRLATARRELVRALPTIALIAAHDIR